jgi:GNAT superfamily N-acetyltransferase
MGTEEVKFRRVEPSDEEQIKSIYYEANSATLKSFIENKLRTRIWFLLSNILVAFGAFTQSWPIFLGTVASFAFLHSLPVFAPPLFYGISVNFARDFKEGLTKTYAKPFSTMIVAEKYGKVVGMVAIRPANVTQKSHFKGLRVDGDSEMTRMAVARSERGTGLGKILLMKAKQFSQSQRYKRMILTTGSPQEIAVKYLYPNCGFVVDKVYPVIGGFAHSYFMSLTLEKID